MRFLEDIKIPVCLSMSICAVRAFIHSLITEEERYSHLYNTTSRKDWNALIPLRTVY